MAASPMTKVDTDVRTANRKWRRSRTSAHACESVNSRGEWSLAYRLDDSGCSDMRRTVN